MSLDKFIYLGAKRALYFSRMDCLGDRYEGTLTRPDCTFREWSSERVHTNARNVDGSLATPEEARRHLSETFYHLRRGFFVNCWHMNDGESAAMWAIYGTQGQSIAIASTYERLFDVCPPEAHVGIVGYLDHSADRTPSGLYQHALHKRKAYEFEREVRAIIFDPKEESSPNQVGMEIPVVLRELVEEVVVSPESSRMFMEVVADVMNAFKIAQPLRRSSLDDSPLY